MVLSRFKWNRPFLVLVVFVLIDGAFAAPTRLTWREFQTEFFSISFPAAPSQRGSTQWVAADSQGRAYSINRTDLPSAPADPQDYFDQTVETLARGTRYDVIYQKALKSQGLAACEFKISNLKHVVVGRLFLRKDQLYLLQVAVDAGTLEEKPLRKFFDSFRVNPSGSRPQGTSSPSRSPVPEDQGQPVQPW